MKNDLKSKILAKYPFVDFSNFDFSGVLEKISQNNRATFNNEQFEIILFAQLDAEVCKFIVENIKSGNYSSILDNFFTSDIDFSDADSCYSAFEKFNNFLFDILFDGDIFSYVNMLETSSNLKRTIDTLKDSTYLFTIDSDVFRYFLNSSQIIEEEVESSVFDKASSSLNLDDILLDSLFNNKNSRRPPATREEEIEYFKKIRAGDEASRMEFLERNYALVLHYAVKNAGSTFLSITDLFQEGYFGLDRAVNLFDPNRGCKFSTYASFWIVNYIKKALRDNHYIKIASDSSSIITNYVKAAERLKMKLEREPKLSEIAKELNISEKKLNLVVQAFKESVSLDVPLIASFEEKGETLKDYCIELSDPNQSVSEIAEKDFAKEFVEEVLTYSLTPKQYDVISLRYGFNGNEPMTLQAVGDYLGISKQAAASLENSALERLSTGAYATKLAEFSANPREAKELVKHKRKMKRGSKNG